MCVRTASPKRIYLKNGWFESTYSTSNDTDMYSFTIVFIGTRSYTVSNSRHAASSSSSEYPTLAKTKKTQKILKISTSSPQQYNIKSSGTAPEDKIHTLNILLWHSTPFSILSYTAPLHRSRRPTATTYTHLVKSLFRILRIYTSFAVRPIPRALPLRHLTAHRSSYSILVFRLFRGVRRAFFCTFSISTAFFFVSSALPSPLCNLFYTRDTDTTPPPRPNPPKRSYRYMARLVVINGSFLKLHIRRFGEFICHIEVHRIHVLRE